LQFINEAFDLSIYLLFKF